LFLVYYIIFKYPFYTSRKNMQYLFHQICDSNEKEEFLFLICNKIF